MMYEPRYVKLLPQNQCGVYMVDIYESHWQHMSRMCCHIGDVEGYAPWLDLGWIIACDCYVCVSHYMGSGGIVLCCIV